MNTNNIDKLNIGLIVLSAAIALIAPYDLVLFSYAFLGPAHYITEIIWLEKRKYFLSGERDYLIPALTCTITALCFFFSSQAVSRDLPATAFLICILSTLIVTYIKDRLFRAILLGMAVVASIWSFGYELVNLAYLFIPTLVHVYIFTGLFILYGALKSKSFYGFLSLFAFLMAAVMCFIIEPRPLDILSFTTAKEQKYFGVLANQTLELLSIKNNERNTLSVMAFISFAYTYHYLNWFSKTQIIRWHEITKRRMVSLVVIYLFCIGAYLIDYSLGFLLLFFLSLLHVVLELPLNFRTIEGLGRLALTSRTKP